MKAVVLAGGFGTRITEETVLKPKPMIEIGGKPILWHIMKIYAYHGIQEFVVCCGYKGYVIKEFFANYFLHKSDITFHMDENRMEVHDRRTENWKITLVDTGENAQTGGRLAAVKDFIAGEEMFCMTYGDGVSDVDINATINFHKEHGKEATVTAVHPPGRFGALEIVNDKVTQFIEKPRGDGALINGGFFVLSPKVLDRISSIDTIWEQEPMNSLAGDGELMAYRHEGFWQPMDTLRDKLLLEDLWDASRAPWKLWSNES